MRRLQSEDAKVGLRKLGLLSLRPMCFNSSEDGRVRCLIAHIEQISDLSGLYSHVSKVKSVTLDSWAKDQVDVSLSSSSNKSPA